MEKTLKQVGLSELIGGNQDALDCVRGMRGNIKTVVAQVLALPRLYAMGIYGDNLGIFWVDICQKDYCFMTYLLFHATPDLLLGAVERKDYYLFLIDMYRRAYYS